MKLLYDFFPILLFFIAYQAYDIYVATAVAIAASAAQVGWSWSRRGRVEPMHLVTLGLVVVLGGATLLLRDEAFIKWKPTVVNWLFAAAFLASQLVGRRPLVQRMMARTLTLPDPVWARLNLSWVAFFLLLGAANLYVAYAYDTDTWVHFKLFGMLGLTVLFVLGQVLYLGRYLERDRTTEEP